MDAVIKRDIILEGLDCANCAAKIEARVNGIDGVKCASLNFSTKTLTIQAENVEKLDNIINEASGIVKKLEPHVVVREKGTAALKGNIGTASAMRNRVEGTDTKVLIRVLAGALVFLAALAFNLPVWGYLISYGLISAAVILKALRNILKGRVFDENFLMTIATIGAFAVGQYPEGVAVMLFYEIGEFFQSVAVNNSRRSIAELMDIKPDFANIKLAGDIKRVSPEQVKIGDIIIVKPGEKIPLDGRVLEGRSMVNTSALTGESVPTEVDAGSRVLSGFININGVLTIEVERIFGESTVSKILDLVQNAAAKKAAAENFITRFAKYYTPAVVFIAIVLAVVPPLVLNGALFSDWIHRALVFLVVSCPCALVISIPLGFFGGIGSASRKGILIKGSNFLEALNNVDTIVFDKTGTLTKGTFKVANVITAGDVPKDDLLKYAAYAGSYSNHPIAVSMKNAYGADVNIRYISEYEEIPGFGTKAMVDNHRVLIGSERFIRNEGISCSAPNVVGAVVHVALDGRYAGYITISDEVKEDSRKAIAALKDIGIKKMIMLTGDSMNAADSIAKELGIEEVYAELLPHQKVEKMEIIEGHKSQNSRVMFVGDGINDAPVLARADIGVAMGGLGSDAAIEASDIVIMTDQPIKIIEAIKIAKRTRAIVWQNIAFALGIKLVVLALGAAGVAAMWEAVFSDVGVALIAVLNSMRIIK